MPAWVFGQALHQIMEDFAGSDCRDSPDAGEIQAFLRSRLDSQLDGEYGESAAAAVKIQFEQMRLRLDELAVRQAARRAEGWQILAAEVDDLELLLDVDGVPFRILGRIDRIDRNQRTGALAIFDYKTGDLPVEPDKSHRDATGWIDLQLPLYRHLARVRFPELGPTVSLGYINVPRQLKDVGFFVAPWTDDDLASADEAAREVIRRVRRSEFWPPVDPPPKWSDRWARICQDNVAERWSPGESEPGAQDTPSVPEEPSRSTGRRRRRNADTFQDTA
jgi:hypothetical protein